jgi:selenium-binding protein 1
MQDPINPILHHTVQGSEIKEKTGLTWPHSSHCLANGQIMISHMGDTEGNALGNFLLLDGKTFEIIAKWSDTNMNFGYDFWYQPSHNVMVSTEWGAPNKLKHHFDPSEVVDFYGHSIHFWNWQEKTLLKTIDLGSEGLIPLETRFLHDPTKAIGYVGCALSSTIMAYYKDDQGEFQVKKVIEVGPKSVSGWALPNMPGLITDIIISMDDKFLFFSNWLHGDIRQYNIEDALNPILVGQVFIGGSIREDGSVTLNDSTESRPVIPTVKGTTLRGGPQMIQLSLDGQRLYVTTSLFSPWDKQFYPDMYAQGSQLLQINVDNQKGGLRINENFLVDFSGEPEGAALAHEVRYPGGDCTSDIFLVQEKK